MSSNNDEIQKTAQSGSSSGSSIKETAQSQGTNTTMMQRTFRDSSQHKRSITEGLGNRRLNYTHDDDNDN